MFEESKGGVLRMFEESKGGVLRMFVENSPESPVPVGKNSEGRPYCHPRLEGEPCDGKGS